MGNLLFSGFRISGSAVLSAFPAPFFDVGRKAVPIQVGGPENQPFGIEEGRAEPCRRKLLKGHAMVAEEPRKRKRRGGQHTDPADGFQPQHGLQQNKNGHRNRDGQRAKQALTQG